MVGPHSSMLSWYWERHHSWWMVQAQRLGTGFHSHVKHFHFPWTGFALQLKENLWNKKRENNFYVMACPVTQHNSLVIPLDGNCPSLWLIGGICDGFCKNWFKGGSRKEKKLAEEQVSSVTTRDIPEDFGLITGALGGLPKFKLGGVGCKGTPFVLTFCETDGWFSWVLLGGAVHLGADPWPVVDGLAQWGTSGLRDLFIFEGFSGKDCDGWLK